MILEDIKYKDNRLNYSEDNQKNSKMSNYHQENWFDVTTYPHRTWNPRIFYNNLVSLKKMGQSQTYVLKDGTVSIYIKK